MTAPTPAKAAEPADLREALELGPVPPKSLAELRREVRDCIGETIPLRRRWVSAIMERVVGPLAQREAAHAAEIQAREAEIAGLKAKTAHLQDIENWLEIMRPVCARATGGPWYHYDEVFRPQFGSGRVTEIQVRRTGKEIVCWGGFDGLPDATARKKNANAALMVDAVNGVRRLIAAMDRRYAACATLKTKGGEDGQE